MADLAQLIYDFRSRHGMTQVELAERLGVKRNTVSQYEAGTAKPSMEVLIRLSSISPEDTVNKPIALLLSNRVRSTFPPDGPEDELPTKYGTVWEVTSFDEALGSILERLRELGAAPGVIRLVKAYRRTGNEQSLWDCFDAPASLAEYELQRRMEGKSKKRRRGPPQRKTPSGAIETGK